MTWTVLALLLTGAGGLVLELVWARGLGLCMGLTVGTQALALGAFLAGNGVGAVLAARLRPERIRPLALAALLALVTAILSAPVVPLLATAGSPAAWGGLRGGLLPLLAVFLAALVGGGVTPLAVAGTVGAGRPGTAGLLWGVNLVGALVGAVVGGGVLVPVIGLTACGVVGAVAYLGAAVLLLGAGRRAPAGVEETPAPAASPEGGEDLVPLAWPVFVGGVAALGLEILLFRMLVLRTGAFTLSLAGVTGAFLLSLGLGSLVLPGLLRRLRHGTAAAALLLLAALGTLAAPHLFLLVEDLLPWHRGGDPWGQVALPLLYGLLVGGPAAVPLGALLPLLYAAAPGRRDRAAAVLTLAQAAGSLTGAAALPLVVLPLLPGPSPFPWAGLFLAAVILSGLVPLHPRRLTLAAGGVGALVLLVGAFPANRAARIPPFASSMVALPGREVVETRHDAVTVATAVYDRRVHEKLLFTDGFQAASLGEEGGYMRLLGHLPLLLHPNPERVVLVALGTGTTLESVVLHPGVKQVDAVELSPAVVKLTGHFPGPGASPPDAGRQFLFRSPGEKRVRLRVTDGRLYLRDLAARRAAGQHPGADVITQEPLLPYTPGALPFYTREFYQIVRGALAPGGLFVQWIPLGSTPPEMTMQLTATLRASFPWVSLWVYHSSALLVAGEGPCRPDPERFARAFAVGRVAEDLRRAGVARAEDLLAGYVSEHTGAPKGVRLVTDDLPFLERFVRPKGSEILQWFPRAFAWVLELRGRRPPPFLAPATFAAQTGYLRGRRQEALERLQLGRTRTLDKEAAAGLLYLDALRHDGLHRWSWTALRRYQGWRAGRRAEENLGAGYPQAALGYAITAVRSRPDDAWNHLLHAAALAGVGRVERAREALRRAAWWWPGVFRWSVYRRYREKLFYSLWRRSALEPLLEELETGWTGGQLGPFRPMALVLDPEPDREGLAGRLAPAFPLQFTGALLEGLAQPGPARVRTLRIIGALGDPWLVAQAADRLGALDEAERVLAAGFLSTTSHWPGPALDAMVGDRSPEVRHALATALARRHREGRALPLLVRLLRDDRVSVRQAAAVGVKAGLGTLAGFDPHAPAAARLESIKRLEEALRLRGL